MSSDPYVPHLHALRFLYQPIASVDGRETGWSEALVRWHLPDGTVRGPLDVLPYWLAPQRHAAFTTFTLTQAATALAQVPEAHVAVNLSPRQVLLPDTVEVLDGLLPEVRERIRIEVTEQNLRDVPSLGPVLDELRERSGGVLLDDVTPDDLDLRSREVRAIDGVKLDRSVVTALVARRSAEVAGFVRDAVARFAVVVAEGIENDEQAEVMRSLGVTHLQGFGIARPRTELMGRRLDRRVPFTRSPAAAVEADRHALGGEMPRRPWRRRRSDV